MQSINNNYSTKDPREKQEESPIQENKKSELPATNIDNAIVNSSDKTTEPSKEALKEEEQDAERNDAQDAVNNDNDVLPPDEEKADEPEF